MKQRSSRTRGAYARRGTVFIGTWIPQNWLPRIDALVLREDSDRSKIIRRAIERKLQEAA